jgi:CRP-like cAMP-binding protein
MNHLRCTYRMLEHLNREVYVAGEFIFHEGEAGDCAYIIESGSVAIFMATQGNEQPIGLVRRGEIFGDTPFCICQVCGKNRTHSHTAQTGQYHT